jgi:Spy/CpxP family protein refolding chaperone
MAAAAESGSRWAVAFAEYRGERLVAGFTKEGQKQTQQIEVLVGQQSAEVVKQQIIKQLATLG